jgi:hypothetical protein
MWIKKEHSMANKTWMKGAGLYQAVIVVMAVIALAGCKSKEQKELENLNAAFASLDESAIAEYAQTLSSEIIVAALKDADPKAVTLVLNNASPALVTTLVQAMPTPASDFSFGQTADRKGVVITGYTGRGGAVLIPPTIEDLPVLEIGIEAFMGRAYGGGWYPASNITSIVIPDSVRIIRSRAFYYARNISSLVIPDSVVSIESPSGDSWSGAFEAMTNLTRVTLPDGLKVIPLNAFAACNRLISINLPASLESIGSSAFDTCSELTDLIIPDSITGIRFVGSSWDRGAFIGCGKLPIRTRQRLQELGYRGEF